MSRRALWCFPPVCPTVLRAGLVTTLPQMQTLTNTHSSCLGTPPRSAGHRPVPPPFPLPYSFSFLDFLQWEGPSSSATHVARTSGLWVRCAYCGMLLIGVHPTQKPRPSARGLGARRGSADQFGGDSCCQAERSRGQ